MAVLCTACGVDNEFDARFCDACGISLDVSNKEASPEPERSTQNASPFALGGLLGFGLPVLAVAVALLYAYFSPQSGLALWLRSYGLIVLLPLVLPLIAGLALVAIRPQGAIVRGERVDAWIIQRHEFNRKRTGKFNFWVRRPFFFILMKTSQWTGAISDPQARQATKFVAIFYFLLLCAGILYLAVTVVIALVILLLMLLALSLILQFAGVYSPSSEGGRKRKVFVDSEIEAEKRKGLFGDEYTEYRNRNGEVVGESREREGIFGGKYTEHSNTRGEVTGESRQQEGIFGDKYVEHTDRNGEVVSETRERESIFGERYAEHTNSDGEVIAESRKREGLLGGKYVETKRRD